MWPDHGGNETNAAQDYKGKQNILHGKLANPVYDSRRLPNASEVNTNGEKDADHRAE
jgi:hypothetical protein